jgi:hypothetical protein
MELRPAAMRFVLEQGLPAVIEVAGRSMEPSIEMGAKVDVAPLAPEAPIEAGDVVLIATARRFVVHQGDADDSTFGTCAREDVLGRMTGFAGDPARMVPTPERLEAAARFRKLARAILR